eukprot:jgi/Psemu1/49614/gm1.49614_g
MISNRAVMPGTRAVVIANTDAPIGCKDKDTVDIRVTADPAMIVKATLNQTIRRLVNFDFEPISHTLDAAFIDTCNSADGINTTPDLYGIWSRLNGISTHKPLKFVKASFASGEVGGSSTNAGMGKIEIKVSESIDIGLQKAYDYRPESVQTSPIRHDAEAYLTMKKNIRSGEGHHEKITRYVDEFQRDDLEGVHLYSITLHYCATPGLIAVGVLPKPPLWDRHRMLFKPTMTAKEKEKLEKGVLSVKRNRNGDEIVELRDDDSDDDDDSDFETNRSGKNTPKKVKSI